MFQIMLCPHLLSDERCVLLMQDYLKYRKKELTASEMFANWGNYIMGDVQMMAHLKYESEEKILKQWLDAARKELQENLPRIERERSASEELRKKFTVPRPPRMVDDEIIAKMAAECNAKTPDLPFQLKFNDDKS